MLYVFTIAGLAAGICVGVLGFADAVLANAVFALFLGSLGTETLFAIVCGGVITYSANLFLMRRRRDWICWRQRSTLFSLVVFALPAVFLATIYLKPVVSTHLRIVNASLGGLLLAVCGYNLVAKPVTLTEHTARRTTAAIGLLSGILGAVAGLSGVITTLWVKAREEWSQPEARGVYQPFVSVMHLTVLVLLLVGSPMRTPSLNVIAYVVFSAIGLACSMTIVATERMNPKDLEEYLPKLVNVAGVLAALNLLHHALRN